ncbi:MAG: hypothetical protein WKI04_17975 [Ferruginibacter sp.]
MKQQNNSSNNGTDGTKTKNKDESQQNTQKGANGISNKNAGKHTKDDSDGKGENTTKKQANSI